MHYEGNIIRPPSEANSIILQATVGCSHNRCTFCGAYKDVRFRIKDARTIQEDIMFAAKYCRQQKKVFVCDGDALIMPTERLTELFSLIKKHLTWVNRISLYGNARSILKKDREDLLQLKELGLDRIYMGLESGHDPTLKKIRKGVSAEQMISGAEIVRSAGLFLSVTVLLGIGGVADSQIHAMETGKVLNRMKPNQIAALTLMVLENTPLHDDVEYGAFQLPDKDQLLAELQSLVENIELDRVQFQANHASNYLPITGRLQKDKTAILQAIHEALTGRLELKAESQRAL